MARNCENCKFRDEYYSYDKKIGDETKIPFCQKRHRLFLRLPLKCPYFEKYIPKPYVEEFTECDKCEYVKQCENDGYVINCTNSMDNFQHFIRGRNAYCRKENKTFEDKKLSEIVEMAKKSNDAQLKNNEEFLQKAIERFEDITYKEFIKEKLYKMYHL